MNLTILHTNDFHNILSEPKAARIEELRRLAGPDALLLDAGDAISAGNVGVRLGGEPILTRMSDAGYDAMTMGNREFHIADAALRHKIGNARFPVLSANMRYKDDRGQPLPVQQDMIVATPGGIRVGIIGVTVPMVTLRMAARHVSAFVFDDPVTVAGSRIDALRKSVDALIVLSHAGYKVDLKIAKAFPELALVVGGHSHVVLEHVDASAGAPVAQAGSHGRFIGRVVLQRKEEGGWSVSASELIALPGNAKHA